MKNKFKKTQKRFTKGRGGGGLVGGAEVNMTQNYISLPENKESSVKSHGFYSRTVVPVPITPTVPGSTMMGSRLSDSNYPTPTIDVPSGYKSDDDKKKNKLTSEEMNHLEEQIKQKFEEIIANYLRQTCFYSNEEKIKTIQDTMVLKFRKQNKAKKVETEMSKAVIPYLNGLKSILICLFNRYSNGIFKDSLKLERRITYLFDEIKKNPKLKMTKKYEKDICDKVIDFIKGGRKTRKRNRTRNKK